MKVLFSKITLVILICIQAQANDEAIYANNAQDVIVPAVYDAAGNMTTSPVGTLVFDVSTNSFRGKGNASNADWRSLSPASGLNVTTISTSTALTTGNDIVNASGTITLTLPAPSSSRGKQFYIKKTDSFSTTLTIARNGSETIDGAAANTTLNTQYESILITSDGTNWFILDRSYPGTWTSYTPTFTNLGTVTVDECKYKRSGAALLIQCRFTTGTTVATAASVTLPGTLTADVGIQKVVGSAFVQSGTNMTFTVLAPTSSSNVLYFGMTTNTPLSAALGNTFANAVPVSFYAEVSITGWN